MGSKRAKDPVANLFNDAADEEVAVHERHSALPEAVQIGVVHDELGQLTCKDKCYEPLRRTGIFPKKNPQFINLTVIFCNFLILFLYFFCFF